ncbi:MAG: HindIII family type II restriction endonuclease [Defluviitaleaceae bacterium]|nr:HindIII family type II restriction endonuclease [Defluviitaleaceae bacterium]
MFKILLKDIIEDKINFDNLSNIEKIIYDANLNETIELVQNMGIIPEKIPVSSTNEKIFTKISDIVVARAFILLNMKSKAISGRSNDADIIAESISRQYSLVSDTKSFRLSRTAKNQKDYKISALNDWRREKGYAVLVAPLFHYPNTDSQIFSQSLRNNVLLFSWEHLSILLKLGIKENQSFTLEQIWKFPLKQSKKTILSEDDINYFNEFNKWFCKNINITKETFSKLLDEEVKQISYRAMTEKQYFTSEENRILNLTKEEAINELLLYKKIKGKTTTIDKYLGGISNAKPKYLL